MKPTRPIHVMLGWHLSPQSSTSHLEVPGEGGRFLHSLHEVVQITRKNRNLKRKNPNPTDFTYNPVLCLFALNQYD